MSLKDRINIAKPIIALAAHLGFNKIGVQRGWFGFPYYWDAAAFVGLLCMFLGVVGLIELLRNLHVLLDIKIPFWSALLIHGGILCFLGFAIKFIFNLRTMQERDADLHSQGNHQP
jgi:hypothetical protein